jgi:hypothetical protein
VADAAVAAMILKAMAAGGGLGKRRRPRFNWAETGFGI